MALATNPTVLTELIGKLCSSMVSASDSTITEMFDAYLKDKDQVLSPLTIRFYRIVQKNRFRSIMGNCPKNMTKADWQQAVNEEAKLYAPKTLRGSFTAIKTVVFNQSGIQIPNVTIPAKIVSRRQFLQPTEIPKFVAAAAPTKYAVPLLLALPSMRISEIDALDWCDIPRNPDFIIVQGTRVLNENNQYIKKQQYRADRYHPISERSANVLLQQHLSHKLANIRILHPLPNKAVKPKASRLCSYRKCSGPADEISRTA